MSPEWGMNEVGLNRENRLIGGSESGHKSDKIDGLVSKRCINNCPLPFVLASAGLAQGSATLNSVVPSAR